MASAASASAGALEELPEAMLGLGQLLHGSAEHGGAGHLLVHLVRLRVHLLPGGRHPPVPVAAGVGELQKGVSEVTEGGIGAAASESGDGVGGGAERVDELGAGEAEEEVVVVGDDLADAVEVDDLVAEARDGGVPNGAPHVEELGH
uniref:Uncharacterized protein n=1 Tax=Arundo donax TaxID=35708 RepID=A0A0A9GAF3_ARUDO